MRYKIRREILPYLAQGKTNKEIGRALGKSPATIHNQVHDIIVMFGAVDRGTAVINAVVSGDVSLDELKTWVKGGG